MLSIKDEKVIIDYCIFRQRKFIQTPCDSCNYYNKVKGECIFDPQPWTMTDAEDQQDLLLDHRNSVTKTSRNDEVVRLYNHGMTQAQIANFLKMKYSTVTYIISRYRRLKKFKEEFPEFYKAAEIFKMDEGFATRAIKLLHGRSNTGERFTSLWPDVDIADISESAYSFGPRMQLLMDTAKGIRKGECDA